MNSHARDLNREVHRGSRIYGRAVLKFYDAVVLKFSNTYGWRCPTELMLGTYDRFVSERHLDVGVGTGWYLTHAALPDVAQVSLMDLHPTALTNAGERIENAHESLTTARVVGNVLEPLPEGVGPFDSISINYLLHCIPGTWETKGEAFRHLSAGLASDGVLFGATILGAGVKHNLVGRALMALYNRLGVFHNRRDDAAGLERALRQHFETVKVDVVGAVALFSARAARA